jgi:hypothetical protein
MFVHQPFAATASASVEHAGRFAGNPEQPKNRVEKCFDSRRLKGELIVDLGAGELGQKAC